MNASDLTPEDIELLKGRDIRIRALDTSLLVQQELRESKTLQLVEAALEEDCREAMEAFADIDPGDRSAVSRLQARVYRAVFFRRTISDIVNCGENAAQELAVESRAMTGEDVG